MSLTHTSGVGPPEDGHSLPLAGSAVGDEGLTVAVFMDRTLTHVRHTRPTEAGGQKMRYIRLCHLFWLFFAFLR